MRGNRKKAMRNDSRIETNDDADDVISVNLLDDSDQSEVVDNDSSPAKIHLRDDSVSVSQQEKRGRSSSSQQQSISPATQTLNILSQNMEDLRYDLDRDVSQSEDRASEKDESTGSNSTKPPTTSNHSSHDPFKVSTSSTRLKQNVSVDNATDNPLPGAEQHLPATTKEGTIERNVILKSDRLSWKHYEAHWEEYPVQIDDSDGVLGIMIQRASFLSDSASQVTTSRHCQVLRVLEDSLAQKAGIEAEDWICHYHKEENDIILASFAQVQEWSHRRPFWVRVLRPRLNASNPNRKAISTKGSVKTRTNCKKQGKHCRTKLNDEMNPKVNTTPSAVSCEVHQAKPSSYRKRKTRAGSTTTAQRKRTEEMVDLTNAESNVKKQFQKKVRKGTTERVVTPSGDGRKKRARAELQNLPFCRLCNIRTSTKPRKHHAWCPKNEFFDNSGAKELLQRITQGKELGCGACEREWTNGRLSREKHSPVCVKNQERLSGDDEQERDRRCSQKSRRSKVSDKHKTTRRRQKLDRGAELTKSRRACQEEKYCEEDDDDDDNEEDDNDDHEEGSIYLPTTRQRIRTLSIQCARTEPTKEVRTKKDKNKVASLEDPKKRDNRQPSTQGPMNEPLQSNWISFSGNPWGRAGHVPGDIVLYGMQEVAAILTSNSLSPRYTSNPFGPCSPYRHSHTLPQDGSCLLALKRDPMATLPWGFRVRRDEFGNACLVDSVDPLSLATSASYLGDQESGSMTALNVNDMLLMINGMVIGGMTQISVELELEVSAPNLILVVSRYKRGNKAARKFADTEKSLLQALDSAANDKQMIGWLEVGNAELNTGETELFKAINSCSKTAERSPNISNVQENVPVKSVGKSVKIDHDDDETNGESCSGHHSNVLTPDVPTNYQVDGARLPITCAEEFEGASTDWEEDHNAWLGCVCGQVHSKEKNGVFWVQCEVCLSWYDVSSKCVGFTEQEVEKVGSWTCWACPGIDNFGK